LGLKQHKQLRKSSVACHLCSKTDWNVKDSKNPKDMMKWSSQAEKANGFFYGIPGIPHVYTH
jgi:hypothetical protein